MTGAREPLIGRHAIGWGLVALGLVTIVAMAAHGAPPWSDDSPGGQTRSVPHTVMVTVVVLAFVAAAVLFVLSLTRAAVYETEQQRRRRWLTAILFLVLLVVVSILRGFVHPSDHSGERGSGSAPAAGLPASGDGREGDGGGGPESWWPLGIVAVGTALALYSATARRRATRITEPDIDAATIAMLDASLDDLRSEPDARRAVIAAYARMENGLAAYGFAREPSETPAEYFRRATTEGAAGPLATHAVAVQALGELTDLAERARFSTHPIDEQMRARAIDALEHLRNELRHRVDTDVGPVG